MSRTTRHAATSAQRMEEFLKLQGKSASLDHWSEGKNPQGDAALPFLQIILHDSEDWIRDHLVEFSGSVCPCCCSGCALRVAESGILWLGLRLKDSPGHSSGPPFPVQRLFEREGGVCSQSDLVRLSRHVQAVAHRRYERRNNPDNVQAPQVSWRTNPRVRTDHGTRIGSLIRHAHPRMVSEPWRRRSFQAKGYYCCPKSWKLPPPLSPVAGCAGNTPGRGAGSVACNSPRTPQIQVSNDPHTPPIANQSLALCKP